MTYIPLELIQKLTTLELEFAQMWEERHPEIELVVVAEFNKTRYGVMLEERATSVDTPSSRK